MQPVAKTYTTTGVKDAVFLDWRIVPFSVSYDVIKTTGGGNLSVTLETTLDDPGSADAVWTALGSALTASTRGSLTAPVQGIRANIGTLSGTTMGLRILQGESIN